MSTNYQAYMQARNNPQMSPQPQPQFNGTQQIPQVQYDNFQQQYFQPFGMKEVDGLNGVNKYPVAPGASVALKDINSMTMFVKSADLSGALLPLRVIALTDITQEYQDRETPVSRAEFNQLSGTMTELVGAMSDMKKMLEDLTAPSVHE